MERCRMYLDEVWGGGPIGTGYVIDAVGTCKGGTAAIGGGIIIGGCITVECVTAVVAVVGVVVVVALDAWGRTIQGCVLFFTVCSSLS